MKTAIITGASSGLGKEFVGAVIDKLPEIEEIWLVARRKERMEELALRNPKKRFRILSIDLTSDRDLEKFKNVLDQEKPDVKALINNAGVERSGNFIDINIKRQEDMIALNAKAATVLSYHTLSYMKAGSMIINVCSVAGFAPIPKMIVYSSTKSYLLNFTKGLRAELKKRKINVLALCPGNMRTEMFETPKVDSVASQTNFEILPFLNLYKVTRKTLKRAKNGKAFYTPRAFYKLYRLIGKLIPHNLITWALSRSK